MLPKKKREEKKRKEFESIKYTMKDGSMLPIV